MKGCEHEWFDEDGYRICAHCGLGSPELGYPRLVEQHKPQPRAKRKLDFWSLPAWLRAFIWIAIGFVVSVGLRVIANGGHWPWPM